VVSSPDSQSGGNGFDFDFRQAAALYICSGLTKPAIRIGELFPVSTGSAPLNRVLLIELARNKCSTSTSFLHLNADFVSAILLTINIRLIKKQQLSQLNRVDRTMYKPYISHDLLPLFQLEVFVGYWLCIFFEINTRIAWLP